jgi:hypothetical protein
MEEELSWNIEQFKQVEAQPIVHPHVPTELGRCGGLRESRVAQKPGFYALCSACQSRIEIVAQDGKGVFAREEPVEVTFGT